MRGAEHSTDRDFACGSGLRYRADRAQGPTWRSDHSPNLSPTEEV
jgi:hypothetical protein